MKAGGGRSEAGSLAPFSPRCFSSPFNLSWQLTIGGFEMNDKNKNTPKFIKKAKWTTAAGQGSKMAEKTRKGE